MLERCTLLGGLMAKSSLKGFSEVRQDDRPLHHLLLGARADKGPRRIERAAPGVAALVKCLAKELGPRVRVNSMAPGRIDTARSRSLDEARASDFGIPTEEQRGT